MPTFEIKKHQHCEGREGVAYSCELWIDGQRAAYVRNAGNGGMTDIDFTDKKFAAILDAHIATLPPYDELPMCRDLFLAQLCDEDEQHRRTLRLCRKKTAFTLKSDPEKVYSMDMPYSQKVAEFIRSKHRDDLVEILNENPKYASPARN